MFAIGAAKDTEPGTFDGIQVGPFAAFSELVFAVAQKREMFVGQPFEQILALLAQMRVGAFRTVFQQFARFVHALAHRAPVADCDTYVCENLNDILAQERESLRVDLARNSEPDKRLAHRIVIIVLGNGLQLAALVAVSENDRVYRDVHREILAIDRSCNGVDEERHVVIDHFDKCERGRITVFFFSRIVDAQQGLAAAPSGAELKMV